MDARTSEETRNEQVIRTLYSLAEAKSKDTPKFVSLFTNDGYFYDVAAGKKYYGRDIGVTFDVYATAFPDMHRELYDLHTIGDLVLVFAADAPFSKSPVQGAKAHADRHGLRVVSEALYPLSATDLAPFIRSLESINPDILFFCSYLNNSAGLLRALNQVGLEPKIVGGAMIGPQNGSIKAQLGPLLNGIVNYEYWLPVPKMMFPGVADMIANYQSLAQGAGADPLGYYVAPQAYAQMQIVEQAVVGTRSLDDARLEQFTRNNSFKTVLGDVKFGQGGSWSQARVLQVQYQGIQSAIFRISKTPEPKRSCGHRVLFRARSSIPTQRRNGTSEA